MNKLTILVLLVHVYCATELASPNEDNTTTGTLMHPKPTHHIYMTQFHDHTELYETSPTGGIAAYITPDAVQVTSLHLEQDQTNSEGENEHQEEGAKGKMGVSVAKAGVVLPKNRKKRERVVKGVGETVGASEEFGRVLGEMALSRTEDKLLRVKKS